MNGARRRAGSGPLGILLPLVLIGSCFTVFAQGTDLLKYTLEAKPGDLTVDRMPTTDPNPKAYQQEFQFTVANPRRSDFKGSAPSCQTFDVEVFFVGVDRQMSVWKWSSGRQFCQHVTEVPIAAGQSWSPDEKIVWAFKATDVKDGKYHAVATFIPTKKKASAYFTITSTN
jgi:hypothetical protein